MFSILMSLCATFFDLMYLRVSIIWTKNNPALDSESKPPFSLIRSAKVHCETYSRQRKHKEPKIGTDDDINRYSQMNTKSNS